MSPTFPARERRSPAPQAGRIGRSLANRDGFARKVAACAGLLTMWGLAQGQSGRAFVSSLPTQRSMACVVEPPARLPDAPEPEERAVTANGRAGESSSLAQAPGSADAGAPGQQEAPQSRRFSPGEALHTQKYIEAGQIAPRLSVTDKVIIGVRDAFSPASIAVWPLAGAYDQAFDSSPNWPRNKAGYFRRVGATAALDSSDTIFGDSIFSPIFHQDPRYYKVGDSRNFLYRAGHAVTRPIVTRTDGGHLAPNLSLLTGTVFGVWLTNAYYPTINQGFDQTAMTFGESIGSAALGFLFVEFATDALQIVHLKPRR